MKTVKYLSVIKDVNFSALASAFAAVHKKANKMKTKTTFEDWRAAGVSFGLQIKFADEQRAKYKYLLKTQQEPGNLPETLARWDKLHADALTALNSHVARGVRWGFCVDGGDAAVILDLHAVSRGLSVIAPVK